MSNIRRFNDKQKLLYEEWVNEEKELQNSFPSLPDMTLSTRKAKASHDLLEKYKKLIKKASD